MYKKIMATEETFNHLSLCMVKLVLNLTFFASNLSYFSILPEWIQFGSGSKHCCKDEHSFFKIIFSQKSKDDVPPILVSLQLQGCPAVDP